MSAIQFSSIDTNPTVANIDITGTGTKFLWFVFAVMLASALAILGWSKTLPIGHRGFHYLSLGILFTAAVAYYCMASDLGSTPVYVEFIRRESDLYTGSVARPTRSIWYARYIDWTITTPLLLLDLLLATGLPLSQIFFIIFMDILMIEVGLIGALVPTSYKWGLFAFGCAAQVYIVYSLLFPARTSAKLIGADVHKSYIVSAVVLNVLWILYPIAWGVADGGNIISPNSEMVFYGILDLLAKPGFIFLHLFSLRKIDYERYGFTSGYNTAATLGAGKTAPGTSHPQGASTSTAVGHDHA